MSAPGSFFISSRREKNYLTFSLSVSRGQRVIAAPLSPAINDHGEGQSFLSTFSRAAGTQWSRSTPPPPPRIICLRKHRATPSQHLASGQPLQSHTTVTPQRSGAAAKALFLQQEDSAWQGGQGGTRYPELSPHARPRVTIHSLGNWWGWRGARARRQTRTGDLFTSLSRVVGLMARY